MRTRPTRWLFPIAALALIAGACEVQDTGGPAPVDDMTSQPAIFQESGLRLFRGADGVWVARLSLGNLTARALDGQVTLSIRDLQADRRLGEVQQTFSIPPTGGTVDLPLPALPQSATGTDLIHYRLDYHLTWGSKGLARGARSAWAALDRIGLLWLQPSHLTADSPSHLAVFAVDAPTRQPRAGVTVAVSTGEGAPVEVQTDALGYASVPLTGPSDAETDAVTLSLSARDGETRADHSLTLPIRRSHKLLLTTDKPLYQPGQTVHIRSLTLGGPDRLPAADTELLLEIDDAKGNRIAREHIRTDAFGVAATTFTLARQVILGPWTVRATLGDTTSEKTFTVDRYVLPRFRLDASLDARWYKPGATVEVTGTAAYFFGRPVDGGTVRLAVERFDVEFRPFTEIETHTDADGHFAASFQLPAHFVGLPLEGGRGLFRVNVEATDAAGQVVSRTLPATIARGGVNVTLLPDGGRLLPDIEGPVHVVATDPSGQPLEADIEVSHLGAPIADLRTDAHGFGRFDFTPPGPGTQTFSVRAVAHGEVANLDVQVAGGASAEAIALRTDKAIYADGDTATVDILLATPAQRVWVDALHGDRTVFQRSADVRGGRATFSFDVDGTMAGDLVLAAYFINARGVMVRDQRLVFVQPDNALTVSLTPRRESHLPGERATVDIDVRDLAGQGVTAAVGVQIVDEALFALTEVQPGLLKVFFNLMAEITAPAIHPGCGGCDPMSVIAGDAPQDATDDERARVAFAALGAVQRPGHEVDTAAAMDAEARQTANLYATRARERAIETLGAREIPYEGAVEAIAAYGRGLRDPWQQLWAVERFPSAARVTFTSRGPDEIAGTADDIAFDVSWYDIAQQRWNEWDAAAGGGWHDDLDAMPGPPEAMNPEEGGGEGAIRVRQNFPETLYVNPAIITDPTGKASFEVDLADSITSWRMTGLASSGDGLVGSGVGSMIVFQDFFVDINFPVALTRNDRVQVPIALYNYLETAQSVTLTLEPASWYRAEGSTSLTLTLSPGEVRGAHFDIRALEVGTRALTVTARGEAMSDAVRRTVRVVPDGRAFPFTSSARFPSGEEGAPAEATVTETVVIPEGAIEGASELLVQVFPGVMSQVTEGMDSLLRMPGGCFEQTTSSAWPNVLVTRYMQQTGTTNPEIEARAMTYITEGYQRLLTFECASGGFNWWEGDDPGNSVLTAVGLMMFTDTREVAFIDDAVIARSAAYLASTQKADGSWGEERHLHAGNENLGAGSLRATAYIAWALLHAGVASDSAERALTYLRQRVQSPEAQDLYTAALMTIALASRNAADSALPALLARLHAGRIEAGDLVHWNPSAGTMVGGYGDSGDIETTAVVTLALLAAGAHLRDAEAAVNWLIGQKDSQGNWGYSTQATVLTLKALLGALGSGSADTAATVGVYLDGVQVGERSFDNFNGDIRWQLDLAELAGTGEHALTLAYSGRGNLSWQVSGAWFIPWSELPAEPASPLAIEVAYDRTDLETDDVLTVNVRVSNSDPARTGMMMAELGIPPGFELDTAPLNAILGQGQVSNYERSALRLLVYLEPVTPEQPAEFSYRLRALYPLEATAPESETYLYYDKQTRANAPSVALQVR